MALALLEEEALAVDSQALVTLEEEEIHLLDLGNFNKLAEDLVDLMILEVEMADSNHFPQAFQTGVQAHQVLKLKHICKMARR